ncbi:uncharacterized protein B0H18DRAFT_1050295 [Fomitopsis serialis]|uniref:uncharacterized protein n=1 Tax=Fomitopsis serialis TaxID=139415 RepID=UPI0020088D0C|nr:uncharacterized protein B0H18DRAFT_1050295 [Neoantrodia serialis]KAH9913207.1 hypothetical protein B0H18DRAFT_1050295 [Neoantrodia serialis]
MPAPSSDLSSRTASSVLGHVNLMMDTFIANANAEDLRAIVRGMIATSPPASASSLASLARRRLVQTGAPSVPSPDGLFISDTSRGLSAPTDKLRQVLSRVRALYGAGLGFASLKILAVIVKAAEGVKWMEGSELETLLAAIDVDISQAIQSCKEEADSGRVTNLAFGRAAVNELRAAVKGNRMVVVSGVGGYQFEQGENALDYWKI